MILLTLVELSISFLAFSGATIAVFLTFGALVSAGGVVARRRSRTAYERRQSRHQR